MSFRLFFRLSLGAFLLAALALAAGLVWLKSEIDQGLLESQAVQALARVGIQAKLGAIHLARLGVLSIDVVEARMPSGPLQTIQFQTLEVDYDLAALLTLHVKLEAVRLVRPHLALAIDPARPPPRLPIAPAGAANPLDLTTGPAAGRLAIERVEIEDGDVSVKLVGRRLPFELTIPRIDLSVRIPPHHAPVQLKLSLAPLGGLLEIKASIDPWHQQVEAHLSMSGVDLAGLAPLIKDRVPALEIPAAPVNVDASASLVDGRPEFDIHLAVDKARVSLLSPVTAGATLSLSARARRDRFDLERLSATLDGQPPLQISGSVVDFARPAVDLQASIVALDVGGVLGLVPPELLEGPVALAHAGTLTLEAKVGGPIAPLPKINVSLDVAGIHGKASAGPLLVPFALEELKARASPDGASVSKLAVRLPGVDLAASADLDGLPAPPHLWVSLDSLRIDLARLLQFVTGVDARIASPPSDAPERAGAATQAQAALPLPPGALALLTALDIGGAVTVKGRAAADLAHLASGLVLPRDAGAMRARMEQWVARLKASSAAPEERARQALADLAANATLEMSLDDLHARLPPLPLAASLSAAAAAITSAAPVLRLEGRIAASPARIEIGTLRASVADLLVALEGAIDDPLGGGDLRLGVRAPALRLPSILALLPPDHPARHAPVALDGQASVSLDALGPVTSSLITAALSLERITARATALPVPIEVGIPRLDLTYAQGAARLTSATIQTPLGTLRLAGELRGIDVPPLASLAQLAHHPIAPPTPDKLPFTAHVETLAPGLDFRKLPPLIGPQIAAQVPAPLLGQVSLEADGTGTLAAPQFTAKIGYDAAPVSLKVGAAGRLLGHVPEAGGRLKLRVADIAALAALIPEAGAKLSQAKISIPPGEPLEVDAELRGTPRSALATATAQVLGLHLDVAARAQDIAARQATVHAHVTLPGLAHVAPLLPPQVAAKLTAAKPTYRAAIDVHAAARGPTLTGTVALDVRDASAAWQGYTGPVHLSMPALAVHLEGQALPEPRGKFVADDIRATIFVHEKPVDVSIAKQSIDLSPERIGTHPFAFSAAGQQGTLDLLVERDVTGMRRLDTTLALPSLDVGSLVARYAKLPVKASVAGSLGLSLKVVGPLENPELLDGEAQLKIPHVKAMVDLLQGEPVIIENASIKAVKDDVVIESPPTITFGARKFVLPLRGSLKEIAGVDNLFKSDPAESGKKILASFGGEKRIGEMLGQDQALRLFGNILYKVKIDMWITNRTEHYEFAGMLSDEESKGFLQHTQEIVDKYVLKAKQDTAEQLGFKKSVLGEDNYKMVQFTRMRIMILDDHFNMVYPRQIPFWRLTITPSDW